MRFPYGSMQTACHYKENPPVVFYLISYTKLYITTLKGLNISAISLSNKTRPSYGL